MKAPKLVKVATCNLNQWAMAAKLQQAVKDEPVHHRYICIYIYIKSLTYTYNTYTVHVASLQYH